MKKMSMGATLTLTVVVSAGVYAQSQTDPPRPKPANPSTGEASAIDAQTFVNRLAIAGMTEVQLGRMAAERAQNADVKAFGQMMVQDHTKAGKELMQLAKQSNIAWPTQLDQKHRDLVDRLSTLQGAAFDREYMNAMVSGHQEVANELRARTGNRMTSTMPAQGEPSVLPMPGAAGNQTSGRVPDTGQAAVGTSGASQGNQALTQWATNALPTVQRHLVRAQELQQKIK
jgi:predicted outer membrane protein